MALIELPKRFDPRWSGIKPLCEVKLDWSNPYAKLVRSHLHMNGDLSDVVSGFSGQFEAVGSGTPDYWTNYGCHFDAQAASFTGLPGRNPANEWTIILCAKTETLQSAGVFRYIVSNRFEGGDAPFSLEQNGAEFAVVNYPAAATFRGATNTSFFASDTEYRIVVSREAGQGPICFVNGKEVTLTEDGSWTANTTLEGDNVVMSSSNFGLSAGAGIENFIIRSFTLLDGYAGEEGAQSLSLDPYQFLKPAVPLFYFVPSAAGPTTHEGAIGFAVEAAATMSAEGLYEAALAQGTQFDAPVTSDAVYEAAIGLAIQHSFTVVGGSIFEAAYAETMNIGAAMLGGAVVEAILETFGIDAGYTPSSDVTIEAAVTEALQVDFEATREYIGEATVSHGIVADAVNAVQADLEAQLSEGVQAEVSSQAEGVLESGLTFTVEMSMTVSGRTAGAVTVDTPDGRTFRVELEDRTFRPAAENRTHEA